MATDPKKTKSLAQSAEAMVKNEEFRHTNITHNEQLLATHTTISNMVKKEEVVQNSKTLLQQSPRCQVDSSNDDQDTILFKLSRKRFHYCDVCNRSFTSISRKLHFGSKRHTRMIAAASQLPDEYDSNDYCKVCERYYTSYKIYRHHLKHIHKMTLTGKRTRTGTRTRRTDRSILPDPDDPNFHCRSCKFTSASRSAYGVHLQRIHDMELAPLPPKFNASVMPNPLDPNFYCDSCNWKYPNRTKYRQHLNSMHDMNLPRLVDLKQRTVNVQSGNGQVKIPPKCNDTGVKPDPNDPDFNCVSCSKKFESRSLYRRHLRRRHKMVDLPPIPKMKADINELHCHICQYTYSTRRYIREHNQKFHPTLT